MRVYNILYCNIGVVRKRNKVRKSKQENIIKITVEVELGLKVDESEQYMKLLEPIPDYRRS